MKPGGTGLCAVLGAIALAIGVWMAVHLQRHWMAADLPHGLSKPILAIELVAKSSEVKMMTGETCADNCRELEWQQSWLADRAFIFAYALYFLSIAVWNAHIKGKGIFIALGLLSIPLTLAGAYYDWLEDDAIVSALNSLSSLTDDATSQIRGFSLMKWRCLFAATGLFGIGFLRDRSASLVTRFLGWITGLAALTVAYTGFTGVQYQEEARIEAGTFDLAVVFVSSLIFFATHEVLSRGTYAALDRLANTNLFKRFTYWPDDWPPPVEPVERGGQPPAANLNT
jgi:hypothetical protein